MGIVGQECPTYGETQQATSGLGGLSILICGTASPPYVSRSSPNRSSLAPERGLLVASVPSQIEILSHFVPQSESDFRCPFFQLEFGDGSF